MASYARPGVYVSETLNPVPPSSSSTTLAKAAFLGDANQGPTTPTLVTSWKQFTNLYGSWQYDMTDYLRYAVRSFLVDNAGGQCYVARVAGTGSTVAGKSFYDSSGSNGAAGSNYSFQVNAANSGAWGNNIFVDITKTTPTATSFNLTVYYQDAIERFTDLTLDSTSARYAPKVINGISLYVVVAAIADSGVTGYALNPAATLGAQLSGGGNATGGQTNPAVAAAVTVFDTVPDSLIINAPTVVATSDVNTLIAYAEGRGDCFVVVDAGATNVSDQLTLAATYTSSSRAAVYYPNVVTPDPTTTAPGVVRTLHCGAPVIAQYINTDKTRDVFKAPAGLQTRIGGAVSVPAISNSDLDSMNTAVAPVNAIRYINGSGIVIMGSRTLKQGYVDKYVPVRRTLIYIEKSLQDLTRYAIFEPNDATLYRSLTATVENFLNSLWRRGGLRGAQASQAYFVICDSSNNPIQSVDNGEVHINVGVALQRPAEFVVISISQYDGGTTVTTTA